MIDMLKNDWKEVLKDEFSKPYFETLKLFLNNAYNSCKIYPKKEELFNALNITSFFDTKVLILGQDPYHGENQAHGLSFSVASTEAKFPPSLRNIFKELNSDLNIQKKDTNLTNWAKQGVLLLNTTLSVEATKAGSHRKKGWEIFTDCIIKKLNEKNEQVIFVLWGNDAKKKQELVTNPLHEIIISPHPSPLSAYNGFFGSRPFSKINHILKLANKQTIDWQS